MIKICFVCTGNTCRSVMAERIFKHLLKNKKIQQIKICSKGLLANGDNISENAKKILHKHGLSAVNRKSVKLKKIDQNTLYIVMNNQMKQLINTRKIISFEDLIGRDVPDPYGQSLDYYEEVFLLLKRGITNLLNKIELESE